MISLPWITIPILQMRNMRPNTYSGTEAQTWGITCPNWQSRFF